MSRVVGRLTLLSEVRVLLERGVPVALHGPTGIGKSALLDALEAAQRAEHGAVVLRANGAAAEHSLPFAGIRDLFHQLPGSLIRTLPDPVRSLVEHGLVGFEATDEVRSDLCSAFHGLLDAYAGQQPVLLLLDDVQWLDPESACIVGYARRRLPGRVGLVATIGPGDASPQ